MLVSGYHECIEDMAVYLPAIKKLLSPGLYPYGANFSLAYIGWTTFHSFVAATIEATHLPVDWAVFLLQIVSIFLLLLGCLVVIRKLVPETDAQWVGVAFVAVLSTLPVTGTALFLVDQHLHPRTIATAYLLFALAALIEKQPRALLWIFLAGLCHPEMAMYGAFHLIVLALPSFLTQAAVVSSVIPLSVPSSPIWRDIMSHRQFQYPLRWEWYEWLGVVAPLLLLFTYARLGRRDRMPVLDRIWTRIAVSTSVGVVAAIVVTTSFPSQTWERLEPMRILHITYVLFVLISGALLGKYVLHSHWPRWLALFLPLSLGMVYAQGKEFSATHHIEWPGRSSGNAWVDGFDWVRQNTPRDAIFALDPQYMNRPGEDFHGFAGIAERTMLADSVKDNSVVEVFPDLAYQWKLEVDARRKWSDFRLNDFKRLKKQFGVSWVVLQGPGVAGMLCPYANGSVMVCRIP